MGQKIVITTFATIYLASLGLVLFQRSTEVSLGEIGFLAWLVVIAGSIGFVYYALQEVFGW